MPNFTAGQLNLITDSSADNTGAFNVSNEFDYIRMAIFEDGTFTGREFFSNIPLSSNSDVNQITIYENQNPPHDIFVKPNDILDTNAVPSGNYFLQFDFLPLL